jgi:hypothetical protein
LFCFRGLCGRVGGGRGGEGVASFFGIFICSQSGDHP